MPKQEITVNSEKNLYIPHWGRRATTLRGHVYTNETTGEQVYSLQRKPSLEVKTFEREKV